MRELLMPEKIMRGVLPTESPTSMSKDPPESKSYILYDVGFTKNHHHPCGQVESIFFASRTWIAVGGERHRHQIPRASWTAAPILKPLCAVKLVSLSLAHPGIDRVVRGTYRKPRRPSRFGNGSSSPTGL